MGDDIYVASSARTLLTEMLASADDGSERRRDILRRLDYSGVTTAEWDEFHLELGRAEAAGAVQLERDRNAHRSGTIARVRLIDPDKLADLLGIERAAARARRALDRIAVPESSLARSVRDELSKNWSCGSEAYGLDGGRSEDAAAFLRILDDIAAERHAGLDMRTFSRRRFGDSKLVEQHGTRIAQALRRFAGIAGETVDETLEAIGLTKLPLPLLIRGALRLDSADATSIVDVRPFVGLPHAVALAATLVGTPAYLITIENLTSFTRFCQEIDGKYVAVYTGGFPSTAAMAALVSLATQMVDRYGAAPPVYHWGDIDGGGVRIFRYLETRLPCPLRPHAMDPVLAHTGQCMQPGGRAGLNVIASSDSAVAALAAYLLSTEGRTLEQEELDPLAPSEGLRAIG